MEILSVMPTTTEQLEETILARIAEITTAARSQSPINFFVANQGKKSLLFDKFYPSLHLFFHFLIYMEVHFESSFNSFSQPTVALLCLYVCCHMIRCVLIAIDRITYATPSDNLWSILLSTWNSRSSPSSIKRKRGKLKLEKTQIEEYARFLEMICLPVAYE